MKQRILFLTGTRADFGKLKPLITVCKHAGFDVQIFATGMHLLAKYGLTKYEISKAGFEFFAFYNHSGTMETTLANTIHGLSQYIGENRPELIVVHGDRVEALAGAIAGSLNNILVAHIEGGELSGTVDELMRHATTKLSHVHFVANAEAKKRLVQMGENKKNVYVIGSPEVDVMLGALPTMQVVREKYAIDFDRYSIVIYHPVTTEPVKLAIFDALQLSGGNYVMIYPNNDTGHEKIIERIDQLEGANFRILPSMRHEYYLTLLKHADKMIGNSSSGVREAPVYGVPTINIGSRQNKRAELQTRISSIHNITDDFINIQRALEKKLPKHKEVYPFGTGDSARLFLAALNNEGFWSTPTQKEFIDL